MRFFHAYMIPMVGALLLSLFAFADSVPDASRDAYKLVDPIRLQTILKTVVDSAGPERFSPESKAKFRTYWSTAFDPTHFSVRELPYPTQHKNGETSGHNLEALLPGKSPDTVIIMIHYDSTGRAQHERENPAVDENLTGLTVMQQTAQILTQIGRTPKYTLRFVATDYGSYQDPEGAKAYVQYIRELAKKEKFNVIGAINLQALGWNCANPNDALCGGNTGGVVFDLCSLGKLGDQLETLTINLSPLKVNRECMGTNMTHLTLWGDIPALSLSEHDMFNNPHLSNKGGDTIETVDVDYFFKLTQLTVAFIAQLAYQAR